MKKILTISAALFLLMINFIGCPQSQKDFDESVTGCVARNIRVDVNDKRMDVLWENSCKGYISGYNIYISEKPGLTDTQPYNNGPYAGDTNPDDGVEVFPAENLENGKKYYVSVAIINPDQSLSKRTDVVTAVCGPRREIELSIRYKSEKDGFSFDLNEYVRADNIANDLYFYSKDGEDVLNSPHKLDGFLKINKLGKLNFKGDFSKLKANLGSINSQPSYDKISIKKGDWIHLVTPDNKNALIQIKEITGNGEERKVSLFIAYSTVAGEMLF